MIISDKVRSETTAYAKDELSRYLAQMAGLHNLARIDLMLIDENEDNTLSDDRYIIDITDGKGTIKGSNSRSILLGVYAYLKHLGCRFLRPGENGEIVPASDLMGQCKIDQKAFYPYRIEELEGAVNDDIIIGYLKWLPKAGFNTYFIQYVTPHIFLKRWHYHELNPYKTPEPLSWEEASEETLRIEAFTKKLGLQLWSLGHGFMFLPFGMDYGPEWTNKLSEEAKPHVAFINGERNVSGGNIAYTNLCYTDPVVKKKIVDWFVSYLKEKPYLDGVVIILADGINNDCECEECLKSTVSDIYVDLVNAIDEALTAEGIHTKLYPCIYVATRWAPLKAKFKNPNRFAIVAPVNSNLKTGYTTDKFQGEMPKNERNKYVPTPNSPASMKFIEDWRNATGVNDFIFNDYHLYSDHYFDIASYMQAAKTLANDVQKLRALGMKGIMNCKTQRSFFPTGLPIYACGEMLMNPDRDFEDIKNEYFEAAFGSFAKETEEYLTRLGELINYESIRIKTDVAETGGATAVKNSVWAWRNNPEMAKVFAQVPNTVDAFMEKANKYLITEENATVKRSFDLLYYHGEIMKRLAEALYEGAMGNREECDKKVAILRDYIMKNEDAYLLEFDAYLFVRRFINEIIFKPGT